MGQPVWRPSTSADLDAICAIERQVHPGLTERREVHAEKLRLFGEGCCMLVDGPTPLGYAIGYPWASGDIPPLDTLFGSLATDADCLFVHDVALLPQARGGGAGRAFVEHAIDLARGRHLTGLALVAVHGTTPVWRRLGFWIEAVEDGRLAAYGETARYMRRDLR